jgi:hypothetical protein
VPRNLLRTRNHRIQVGLFGFIALHLWPVAHAAALARRTLPLRPHPPQAESPLRRHAAASNSSSVALDDPVVSAKRFRCREKGQHRTFTGFENATCLPNIRRRVANRTQAADTEF